MNYYKINFEQLRQRPEITEMLSALERGFKKYKIDFYLIGAVARDLWMNAINRIPPRRTTGDIDFAVLINDKGTYEALRKYLVEAEGFQPTRENAFVLLWKDKTEVDLLPFGAIEDADGKVSVEGTGYTNVHVPGFKEIYEEGLPEAELGEVHIFKFCTLPGIVVLKLLAWNDRPEIRRSDIYDISDILNYFFKMYDEIIWEHHNDLYADENEDLSEIHISARVMGREMGKIARRSERLFGQLIGLLSVDYNELSECNLATIMAEYYGNTVEENVALLNQIEKGLKESKNSSVL